MIAVVWTDERVEELKKLWAAGLSCSQISGELSKAPFENLRSVSRNAAIGKIHRLGLSGRVKDQPPPREPRVRKVREQYVARLSRTISGSSALAPAFEPEIDPEIIAGHDNVVPLHQRLTLLDLNSDTCHWPIGDPLAEDFFFCGGNALKDKPYCAHHQRIAHDRRGG